MRTQFIAVIKITPFPTITNLLKFTYAGRCDKVNISILLAEPIFIMSIVNHAYTKIIGSILNIIPKKISDWI